MIGSNLRFPYNLINWFGCCQSGGAVSFPSDYPSTTGATEVWNWGEATGAANYLGEVTGDTYVAGGTSSNISYGQTGPPGTNMNSIIWGNASTDDSHHTAPGTTSGQSNGAVDSSMQPGSSSFKFYFLFKSLSDQNSAFYYFFDYDLQEDGSTFNEGIQIGVSTAGIFAPCSLLCIIKDSDGEFLQFHAKTTGTNLFEDDEWFLVEMIFDRSKQLPIFKLNRNPLQVKNTFGGNTLDQMADINPTAGIRFGQREYIENGSGRANIQMAAAAYSKDLTYTWE